MDVALSSAGILTNEKDVHANYVINAYSVFLPLFGVLGSWIYLDSLAPTAWTIYFFFFSFFFTVIGLIIGLHRYFTHRSFDTHWLFRLILGIGGSWSMQGPLDRWVADHRRHHRYTDQPYDVHSPCWINQDRIDSRILGFVHSHFLWLFTGLPTDREKYAKDIMSDQIGRMCSEHYFLFCLSSLLLPAVAGYSWGGPDEAVRSFLWAGCIRVIIIQQFSWFVNSVGHMFGRKTEGSKSEARDNIMLTLFIFGEGLHSYHHAHEGTAANKPTSLDLAGQLITLLEKLGVVWNVKRY